MENSKNEEISSEPNNTQKKSQEIESIINSHINSFNLKDHSLEHETNPYGIGYILKR